MYKTGACIETVSALYTYCSLVMLDLFVELYLLARHLWGEQAKHAIHQIRSKTNKIVTSPEEINVAFRDFYSDLYSSKSNTSQKDYNYYFFLIIFSFAN